MSAPNEGPGPPSAPPPEPNSAPSDSPASNLPAAWSDEAKASHYETERFPSPRRSGRDLHLVQHALERVGFSIEGQRILDAPSGTGRLHSLLKDGRLVGADRSREMLHEALRHDRGPVLCADLLQLPFRTRSFDLVVACRILHHAQDDGLLQALVSELVRVSDDLIIASFFDCQSWHAWRKRKRAGRHRRARSREHIQQAFEQAGATIVGFEHSFRFWSQQSFAIARRGGAERDEGTPRSV